MTKTIVGLLLSLALILTACTQMPKPVTQPAATQPPQAEQLLDIQLPIRDATDLFRKVALAAGEAVTTPGLYFLDTATGKAEGWGAAKDDSYNFAETPDGRYITVAREPAESYLIDRVSGKAWGWGRGDLRFVGSQGNRLLFQKVAGLGGEPQQPVTVPEFYLTNEAMQPLQHITLQDQSVVGAQVTFRPDGQTLAIMTGPMWPQGSLKQSRLYLVDTKTGKGRLMMDAQEPRQQVDGFRAIHLSTVQGGQVIQVASEFATNKSPGQWEERQSVRRFDWAGKLLLDQELPGGRFSPDGKLVAHGFEAFGGVLDTVEVVDAATGQPRFRVLGATSAGWLADGSGILLNTIDGTKTVDLAGVLKEHTLNSKARELKLQLHTTPDPTLFQAGERTVLDATGRVQAELKLGQTTPGSNGWYLANSGFGATAKELRVQVYHNYGHDGRDGVWIYMPPRVEKPPYAALPLQVKAEPNDCLNLRMDPAQDGRVIRCLPAGTKLAVGAPMALGGHDYSTATYASDGSGLWLFVRTEKEEQGWVAWGTKAIAWAD